MKKLYYTDGVERVPIPFKCPVCDVQLYDTASGNHGYCDTCKKIYTHTMITPLKVYRIIPFMDKEEMA